ncbi:hypothetical protein P8452_47576 [Trifolium repens]|nr:hypothetical protein P8452_47576 [Trifolium repens]
MAEFGFWPGFCFLICWVLVFSGFVADCGTSAVFVMVMLGVASGASPGGSAGNNVGVFPQMWCFGVASMVVRFNGVVVVVGGAKVVTWWWMARRLHSDYACGLLVIVGVEMGWWWLEVKRWR